MTPPRQDRPPNLPIRAVFAAGCGGAYGLALARFLFEAWPLRLELFNSWPGALSLAALAGAACAIGMRRARAVAAPVALLLPLISLLSPDVDVLRSFVLLAGSAGLFGILIFRSWNFGFAAWLAPLSIFVILLALYWPTLGPTVGEADPFEFQVAAARLGVAHGSGYPLLILLGRLFAELPLGGTFAFRVNVSSAAAAALAAAGVYALTARLGAARLVAWLAALAYGVSFGLWARATEIETYPLNAAFLALILYLCIELIEPAAARGASPITAYALAFAFGLGLTNHLTTILLAPACAVALAAWFARSRAASPSQPRLSAAAFSLRHSAFILLFFLLGLSVYAYLPLRWPAVNNGQPLSWEMFTYIIRGGEATGPFNPWLPFQDTSRYASWAAKIVGEFTPAGFGLAMAGGLALTRRASAGRATRWLTASVVGLMFAAHAYFALAYNTREPDWSDFFLALNLLLAVLIGLGLQAALDLARRIRSPDWLRSAAHCWLLTLFCLLPLSLSWQTRPRVDRSLNWQSYQLGQYTLKQPFAAGATILADPPRFAPLYYSQSVEAQRPDLDIVIVQGEEVYRAVLDERLAAGRAVYLGRYLAGLGSFFSLRSVGPLAEVSPEPFTTPLGDLKPLTASLAPHIQLAGYRVDSLPSPASHLAERLAVTLYWRIRQPADDNYLVNLRLVDQAGAVAWRNAARVPVNGLYPTNAWRPGEVISDFHLLAPEGGLAPGRYTLQAALRPPFVEPGDGWVDVAKVVMPPYVPTAPPHALRARFGDQWLMGYAAPDSVPPGSPLEVTLYWLRGGSDSVTALGETRSLAAWPIGSLAPLTYELRAPTDGPSFELRVDPGVPARCGWLQPATAGCRLPPIRMAGEALAAEAVNYDGQILLRRVTLHTAQARPGDVVEVTLEWQALQTLADDYTVFVHLVGPEGRLHGQVDFWPVVGTRATSSWRLGEVIVDPYRVTLDADAPAGAYGVHVGFYLLETLQRLPVLGLDGAPVDDKFVVGGLTVSD